MEETEEYRTSYCGLRAAQERAKKFQKDYNEIDKIAFFFFIVAIFFLLTTVVSCFSSCTNCAGKKEAQRDLQMCEAVNLQLKNRLKQGIPERQVNEQEPTENPETREEE